MSTESLPRAVPVSRRLLWPPFPAGKSQPSWTVSSLLALNGRVGQARASAVKLRGIFILPIEAAILGEL